MSRAFFDAIESRFGRLGDLVEKFPGPAVLTSRNHIDAGQLRALFHHECAALHVKGFYDYRASAALAKNLLERDATKPAHESWEVATGKGMESSDVRAVCGTPFAVAMNDARSNPAALGHYFDEAESEIRLMRSQRAWESPSDGIPDGQGYGNSGPSIMSPLDKLRLELDEAWRSGATLLKDTRTGRPYLPGLGRIMKGPTKSPEGFAHVDELLPISSSQGLFSANIYLEMPPSGGELHIWGVAFKSKWDFYRHASTLSLLTTPDPEGQQLLRAKLLSPRSDMQPSTLKDGEVSLNSRAELVRLCPDPGDLVLLCAQRPHAVQGFPIGKRVSLQSFLTHSGKGSPIVIDN